MNSYDDLNIWDLANFIHQACVDDDLLYFVDKEGKEIKVNIQRVLLGRIVLEERK